MYYLRIIVISIGIQRDVITCTLTIISSYFCTAERNTCFTSHTCILAHPVLQSLHQTPPTIYPMLATSHATTGAPHCAESAVYTVGTRLNNRRRASPPPHIYRKARAPPLALFRGFAVVLVHAGRATSLASCPAAHIHITDTLKSQKSYPSSQWPSTCDLATAPRGSPCSGSCSPSSLARCTSCSRASATRGDSSSLDSSFGHSTSSK